MALPYSEWTCNRCGDSNEDLHFSNNSVQDRYVGGIYAGRQCDHCWQNNSGFKQDYQYDYLDAGEYYDEY